MTRDLRSNPLIVGGCGREDGMVYSTGGKGDWGRSGAGVGQGIGFLAWNVCR